MSDSPYTVTIVGGGTAGWITAGILSAGHDTKNGRLRVRLIESPDVAPIGVGEGTWPTMRATLRTIGVSEHEFLKECQASFKQGSLFKGWIDGGPGDGYYHPFELPLGYFEANPAISWLSSNQAQSFSKSVCPQEYLCEANLSPKTPTTPQYAGVRNYGYHLDAGRFSTFIKKHCVERLGVEHISDTVVGIDSHDDGMISAVLTEHHGAITGELFIDCTGFRSVLLGQHFGVEVEPIGDQLFVDTAFATQVPNARDAPIASQTISTARAAGWIWDIGLSDRRGVGYAYSSAHTEENAALSDLQTYLGLSDAEFSDLSVRKLDIKSGYRKEFWKKNCVAIGLSAGFVEPLEASAIILTEMSAKMISQHLPIVPAAMPILAKRFNRTFKYHWTRIIDFLKLHYVLSRRTEPFWADNRNLETVSDRLKEDLLLWRHHAPWTEDFTHKDEIFPVASYQYILYGMGFDTKPSLLAMTENDQKLASHRSIEIERIVASSLSHLESNTAALHRIRSQTVVST